jgi:hypothetical protein
MSDWRLQLESLAAPAWLKEAAEAALADLQLPHPVALRLDYEAGGARLMVGEAGERHGAVGFWPEDQRGAQLIVRLADYLQEQLFPETRAAWGEARPHCPLHEHPAQAVELHDEPWWVCPTDGREIAMVGRFPAD